MDKKYKINCHSTNCIKDWQTLTMKEALNCTASIAANIIVDAISFVTGVLLCDPNASFSQIRPLVPKSGQVQLGWI